MTDYLAAICSKLHNDDVCKIAQVRFYLKKSHDKIKLAFDELRLERPHNGEQEPTVI